MSADISSEVKESGQSISDFLKRLGQAVATSQDGLDDNTTNSAKELSKILVDVPAAVVEEYNDDGQQIDGSVRYAKVPMSTILLPVAYQFSQVTFQADLKLSEIDNQSGIRIFKNYKALKASGSISTDVLKAIQGKGGVGTTLEGSAEDKTNTFERTTDKEQDSAFATLRVRATLQPRKDLQLPEPMRTRRGPRILALIISTAQKDFSPASSGTLQMEDRTVVIDLTILKRDGQPVSDPGSKVQVAVDSPAISSAVVADGTGKAKITLQHVQRSEGVRLPAVTTRTVQIRFGDINEDVSVSI